eukprot:g23963.t1
MHEVADRCEGARSDNAAVEVSFEETDLNTWIALRSALALAFQDPEQGDPKLFQEAKDKSGALAVRLNHMACSADCINRK